jgi:hypothetical protein
VLDDYSALREITPEALAQEARLFALRDAYLYNPVGMNPAGTAGIGSLSGNTTVQNPPPGAVFTYNVAQALPADAQLVLTITDDGGRQVRRIELDKSPGLRRVAWNLRGDLPPGTAPPAGGRGGGGGGQGGTGRGGVPQGPLAAAGRYTATLGKKVGETVTPVGAPQVFRVVPVQQ